MSKLMNEKEAKEYCKEINEQWLVNTGARLETYYAEGDSLSEARWKFWLIVDGATYDHFCGTASGHDYYLFQSALLRAKKDGIFQGKNEALANITEHLREIVHG